VLVAGGGMGGVAAALAAARRGCRACLLEETDWLGGQLSAQGVSALDEHAHIETVGGTASYYALREALRDHYRRGRSALAGRADLNPGDCWVTRLAFEPAVGAQAMLELLAPHVESGRLRIFLRTKTVGVDSDGRSGRILLALDLETGPHDALSRRDGDRRHRARRPPAARRRRLPGRRRDRRRDRRGARPVARGEGALRAELHLHLRRRAPARRRAPRDRRAGSLSALPRRPAYSLTIEVHGGEIYGEESGWLEYRPLRPPARHQGRACGPYRRLLSADLLGGDPAHDLTLFNWPGNDYRDRSILDRPPPRSRRACRTPSG
jgi:hypothetical protein